MLARAHVLISRTDNIGDVVLTLPLAGYLKRLYPDIRIGFICRGYVAPLVRLCRSIDYVLEIDNRKDLAADLAQTGADTIIFCKPDRRVAKAAKTARIARRVGTSHRVFHWWYANRLAHFSRAKSLLHEAQLNFLLLRPLGIDYLPALAEIPSLYGLPEPGAGETRDFPREDFNLVMHPKSNGNGREWPVGHYAEVARLLKPHAHIKLWVTGSAPEGQWLLRQGGVLLQLPNVGNLCGKFSLGQLAAFIRRADGFIASSTGPLHMAAALGVPTLGLFPPLRPVHPGRWAPLGTKALVLCQTHGCPQCHAPTRCECMLNIRPEQVVEVVLKWAAAPRPTGSTAECLAPVRVPLA